MYFNMSYNYLSGKKNSMFQTKLIFQIVLHRTFTNKSYSTKIKYYTLFLNILKFMFKNKNIDQN